MLLALTPQSAQRLPILANNRIADVIMLLHFLGVVVALSVFVPLMAGATAIAAERSLGVIDWQLALPVSRRKQFTAKCIVVCGVTILIGAALPLLLTVVLRAAMDEKFDSDWFQLAAFALPVAAAGMYVSSLSREPYRAFFAGAGVLAAAFFADWFVAPYLPWYHRLVSEAPWWRLALLGLLALLTMLLAIQHFRPLRRGWRVVIAHIAIIVVAINVATYLQLRRERHVNVDQRGYHVGPQTYMSEAQVRERQMSRRAVPYELLSVKHPALSGRVLPNVVWPPIRIPGSPYILTTCKGIDAHPKFGSRPLLFEINVKTGKLIPRYTLRQWDVGSVNRGSYWIDRFNERLPVRAGQPLAVAALLDRRLARSESTHELFLRGLPITVEGTEMGRGNFSKLGPTNYYAAWGYSNSSSGGRSRPMGVLVRARPSSIDSIEIVDIATDPNQAWRPSHCVSRDGKWFSRTAKSGEDIAVYSTTGSTSFTLTAADADEALVAPSGRELTHWFRAAPMGNAEQVMSVSPDGQKLVFNRVYYIDTPTTHSTGFPRKVQILWLDLQTGKEKLITELGPSRPALRTFGPHYLASIAASPFRSPLATKYGGEDSWTHVGSSHSYYNAATGIASYSQGFLPCAWSEGGRFAVLYDDLIKVFDAAGKPLRTMTIPEEARALDLAFFDEDTILFWGHNSLWRVMI